MGEAFRCSVYWGFQGPERVLPPCLVHGEDALRLNATVPVRLLPVAQRLRYREEFGDELAELPRSQRCGYALRVLARAWQLRRALVETVRTSDGEPVHRAER